MVFSLAVEYAVLLSLIIVILLTLINIGFSH